MAASEVFAALGTTAVVVVSEPAKLAEARAVVEETVAAFDQACSRFRQDSELTAVNRGAGSWVKVTPLLLDALQAAVRAAAVTDGDVDPTVGGALIALGYDRDFGQLCPQPQVTIAEVPGWRSLALDPEHRRVRVARGVSLDLGATAKALCADRAAAAAHQRVGCGVLASLGGDLAVAGSPPPEAWRIRVTDDHRAGIGAPGQWISLASGGLATSSTTVRRWHAGAGDTGVHAGLVKEAHHIVDPATGRPTAELWRTVTVVAASCLDANIAATAAIVRGARAVAWLETLGLPSRLVGVDGSARHLAGWPAAGDDLAPACAAGVACDGVACDAVGTCDAVACDAVGACDDMACDAAVP